MADGSLLGDANGVDPAPGRVKDSGKWQKPRFSRKSLMKCCLVKWIIASTQPQDKGETGHKRTGNESWWDRQECVPQQPFVFSVFGLIVDLNGLMQTPVGSTDWLCLAVDLRVKYLEITELHIVIYQKCWVSITILYTSLKCLFFPCWSFLPFMQTDTPFPLLRLQKIWIFFWVRHCLDTDVIELIVPGH